MTPFKKDAPNREFQELIGGKCWHDLVPNDWPHNRLLPIKHFKCTKCGIYTNSCEADINPDYAADPRLVLREMMKREDWPDFSERLFWYIADKTELIKNFCEVFILDTTGKLRDAAIKFMKEKEK